MTPTQNAKKEGGSALSALSTLFGKKTARERHLEALEAVPSITPDEAERIRRKIEKESPAISENRDMTFSEERAAEKLWIRSEDLTALRKQLLTVGKDYVRTEGIVRITAGGLDRLKKVIEEGTTLVVLGGHVVNPHLVLARLPGKEDVQRVRVADNKEWCKGMVMTGCVPAEIEKFWNCSVRPRFKGRA